MTDNDTAFLFPGHGVQEPGMGRWLFLHCVAFRELVQTVQESLPLPYSIEDLLTTEVSLLESDELAAQIAIYMVNAGYDLALKKKEVHAAITYGYSSGLYSALCSCGAVSVVDGLRLVLGAYDCMWTAIEEGATGMLAVTGLTLATIRDIVAQAEKSGTVVVANINSPRQFFLSGERRALEKAFELARRPGLLNIRWLPVSIPYHSPLIKPATDRFELIVRNIRLAPPRIPIVSGAEGKIIRDAGEIRTLLVSQLVNKVDFPRCLETLLTSNIVHFWEVGYGSFLYKLIRREQRIKHIHQAQPWIEASGM